MKPTKHYLLILTMSLLGFNGFTQTNPKQEKLDSVVIASSRIDLPFKENSRTIKVITASEIKQSAVYWNSKKFWIITSP